MDVMRSHELLQRRSSRLLLIDVQEKIVALLPVEVQRQFTDACRFMCEGANLFGVPIDATEQYPQGLGPTVDLLSEFAKAPKAKKRFSALECLNWPAAAEAIDDRFQIVVIGMETHVCVLQTVLDLLASGYQTYVVVDALAARGGINHSVAIERMANAGAIITTAEGVLFEWCESADAPEFRQYSTMIKKRQF